MTQCLLSTLLLLTPMAFADNIKATNTQASYFNTPNLNQKQLSNWLKSTTASLFSFQYSQYKNQLKNNMQYFTQSGFSEYLKQLDALHILDQIVDKQLNVTASPSSTAKIVNAQVIDYHYTWFVNADIKLVFQNSSQAYQQNVQLHLVVTRVAPSISGMGVAIDSIKIGDH